ncbi:MAG: family ATPase [Bacteroidetes bacterium]|nr:family ATPase [Bacteroidota bacterium]
MQPLAEILRPKTLESYIGQKHLVGEGEVLRIAVENRQIHSMILWGPPGVGKTTLALLISELVDAECYMLSAISSGVKDIRSVIDKAEQSEKVSVLFIDEIHRFTKAQQDSLLGAVERGVVTLIGATTENPSFEVIAPLLSRCQVYVLNSLDKSDLEQIKDTCITYLQQEMGITIEVEESEALYRISGGDARKLINAIELTVKYIKPENGVLRITNENVTKCIQKNLAIYDKAGENHYDIISAFIKSIRGSDPNAAVYWMARMINAGEDPLFIARRMIILASEDIGNANPNALLLANSCFQAVHQIGMPEGRIILSQTAIYLASSPKSNASYSAIDEAIEWVYKTGDLPVPLHIRNAPTSLMKELNYGKDYQYAHSFEHNFVNQEFLPESISGKKFYEPQDNPRENELRKYLKNCWKDKYRYILLFLIGLFSFGLIQAQDLHYSQYYTAHYLLNPAMTGVYDGTFRANLNQKTQWLSVTKPFVSLSGSIDAPIYKNNKLKHLVGLGLNINSDEAGDSEFRSLDINLAASFVKSIGYKNNHKIGIGVTGGYVQRSLNYAALHFDEQFQFGFYDPTNPITELFGDSKITYFDMGLGVFYSYSPKKNQIYSFGFSAYHLGRPNQSYRQGTVVLPIRFTPYFGARIPLTGFLTLTPSAFASLQGNFSEYTLGSNLEYSIKKNSYTTLVTFGAGLFYRWSDALIINVIMDIQNLRIGASYDLNLSTFTPATRVRGGFEISIQYLYKKSSIGRTGREPCPYEIM